MTILFDIYFELIEKILRRVKISKVNILGLEISLDEDKGSIDERIKKIEAAKQNLLDGLSAIKELEKEAEKNKYELENALIKLSKIKTDKINLEAELNNIKQVISSDVSTFQKLAGVPTEKEKRKERIIGFFSGIIASIISAGIIWVVTKVIHSYFT
ncbi:hypothetical protein [Bacteroides faecis]|uniref:hypothetical protein n=1 Tax=Bacteroides faecis TaxID=674529 RepID=UPI001D06631A|nr:hypothetical protein [Bacteroides faecis]MCB6635478.1 hypothetical protein [Bacteroides faecis]MCE8943792.1 hypothetical protein [Bacteroides faecis]